MSSVQEDDDVVAEINRRTGAALTFAGRSERGKMGGAIYVQWPDGRQGVVTRFHGALAEAERVADILAYARDRGLPVPRYEAVVAIDDGVVFVQERLPAGPPSRLTPARVDAIADINDRLAGALADLADVSPPPMCRLHSRDGLQRLAEHSPRAGHTLDHLVRVGSQRATEMEAGTDLVHVDLSAANVLFDGSGTATGIVDWNLGAYRGDRHFALVTTRFDREWFVRAPDADPIELAAAARLDEILADRIAPATRRIYWAQWLLHRLQKTVDPAAIDWHFELAEGRTRAD